jgi:restriction system protein
MENQIEELLAYGRIGLETGYHEAAREYFEQVLALDSTNEEAKEALAEIDNILDRRRAAAPMEPSPKVSWRQRISTWVNAYPRHWKFAGLILLLLCLSSLAWKIPWLPVSLIGLSMGIALLYPLHGLARYLSSEAEKRAERRRRARERYLAQIERLDQLQAMSPTEFERFVARLFEQMGHSVTLTQASGDKGVDIFLDGCEGIVQCKRYKGSVGQPVVRDFYGTMIHYKAERGYIVTTGTFSLPAQSWAEGKPIHLVDGMELVKSLEMVKQQNDLGE